jgi:hypothetical protein
MGTRVGLQLACRSCTGHIQQCLPLRAALRDVSEPGAWCMYNFALAELIGTVCLTLYARLRSPFVTSSGGNTGSRNGLTSAQWLWRVDVLV